MKTVIPDELSKRDPLSHGSRHIYKTERTALLLMEYTLV